MDGSRPGPLLALALALTPACASDRPAEPGPVAEAVAPPAAPVEASAPVDARPTTVYRVPKGARYFHAAGCSRVQVGALPMPIASAERHFDPCPLCIPQP